MIKEKLYLILALLVCFALSIWLCLRVSSPTSSEIQTQTSKIEVIKEDVFKDPTLSKVQKLQAFGQLPVFVNKEEQGKDNPFAP